VAYEPAVPVHLVLACGIFGNISRADIARTIEHLPMLCAPNATVIWARHRRPPDLTTWIRERFGGAGFAEVAFDSASDAFFGVGTHRLERAPSPVRSRVRLFTFVSDGAIGWCQWIPR
jgi:hypothetical protein